MTGLGIESTSFRDGLPHESVLEMDILTGTGEVITCRPQGEHADLFHGFANSYGSLGYATRLLIELAPVARAVALRHVRFDDLESLASTLERIVETQAHEGREVHYLDGVVFSATESYLVLGRQTDEPGPTSDYTGMNIYYRSIQHDGSTTQHDLLTIKDYLWRWDTDWFWCSRAFGAQNPASGGGGQSGFSAAASTGNWSRWTIVTRSGTGSRPATDDHRESAWCRTSRFPRGARSSSCAGSSTMCRSSRSGCAHCVFATPPHRTPGRCTRCVPEKRMSMSASGPRSRSAPAGSGRGQPPDRAGRRRPRGHKSLYSDSFYDRATFDRLYGGAALRDLKDRYDPDRRLLDLHDKAVRRQ